MGPRPQRVPTPWFGWGIAEVTTGLLSIASNVKVDLQGAVGLTPLPTSPEPVSNPAGVPATRTHSLAYQVNDLGRLGEIRWEPAPPRVAVTIESQMTLYADFAEWVSVLRYDVTGGALDAAPPQDAGGLGRAGYAPSLGGGLPAHLRDERSLVGLVDHAKATVLGLASLRDPLDPPLDVRPGDRLSRPRPDGQ